MEDRRERWRHLGERALCEAPSAPCVYVFRDWAGGVLYVGKAVNLRRRLAAHFAEHRWRTLPPAMARVTAIEWQRVGSEIEALSREAILNRDLQPAVNVQTAAPTFGARAIPASLVRDVILLVPSSDSDAAQIVAARADGATLLQRTPRSGVDLARSFPPSMRIFLYACMRNRGQRSRAGVFVAGKPRAPHYARPSARPGIGARVAASVETAAGR